MSNPETEAGPPVERDFHLIEGELQVGPTGPFFNHDWGPPLRLRETIELVKRADSPEDIVRTVINQNFPDVLTENNYFQEHMNQALRRAVEHYERVIWPTYRQGSANTDLVIEIYDATEEFENCTLLHALRSVEQDDAVTNTFEKDPERIAQILILEETNPGLLAEQTARQVD